MRDDALAMQLAVALSILTYAPLRIGNLSALHLEKHLRWTGPKMTGALVLDIDGAEVKNDQTLSFPLPAECANLIRLYVQKYHRRLTTDHNTYLFPSDLPGQPKRSDTLGKQLSRLILPRGQSAPLQAPRAHHRAAPLPWRLRHDLSRPRP